MLPSDIVQDYLWNYITAAELEDKLAFCMEGVYGIIDCEHEWVCLNKAGKAVQDRVPNLNELLQDILDMMGTC